MTALDQPMARRDGSARFWNRHAAGYARRPVADEAAYQKKLQTTRAYLRPDMHVLEFGCGTGSTALSHAPFVRCIHAIDFSARMIEIARDKAVAAGITNVTFEQAGFDGFDTPDAPFDAVLGLSILHLLDDRDAAIAKVHRLLKPGGVFVSSTACIGDSMGWFKALAPVGRLVGLLPLVRVFTTRQMLASLKAAGFAIEHEWHPGKGKAVFVVARKR